MSADANGTGSANGANGANGTDSWLMPVVVALKLTVAIGCVIEIAHEQWIGAIMLVAWLLGEGLDSLRLARLSQRRGRK